PPSPPSGVRSSATSTTSAQSRPSGWSASALRATGEPAAEARQERCARVTSAGGQRRSRAGGAPRRHGVLWGCGSRGEPERRRGGAPRRQDPCAALLSGISLLRPRRRRELAQAANAARCPAVLSGLCRKKAGTI